MKQKFFNEVRDANIGKREGANISQLHVVFNALSAIFFLWNWNQMHVKLLNVNESM